VKTTRSEIERPTDPHLLVGARRFQRSLVPFAHPAQTDLGVGLQSGLLLEERARFLEHRKDIQEPPTLLLSSLLGAFLRRDRARPSPAKADAMEHAAKCLLANQEGPLLEQLIGQKLAAPARAQPAVFGGSVLFDQTLDVLAHWLSDQRFGTSHFAVVEGRLLLPDEARGDRIDGGSRAEEDPSDLGGRTTIGAEQHYVHPKPPARLPIAFHLLDEVLAFS
jgi:hypothetical protein